MIDDVDLTARHARGLAELSELGLSLARDLHACALAAEEPLAKAEVALAFHRVSRSVRQSMALEARLMRDLRRQEGEAGAEAVKVEKARLGARKAQVRAAVERLIWNEAETEDAGLQLIDELDERLDEAALYETFADGPVEAIVARLRADLGLAAAALPEEAGSDRPAWRSSA